MVWAFVSRRRSLELGPPGIGTRSVSPAASCIWADLTGGRGARQRKQRSRRATRSRAAAGDVDATGLPTASCQLRAANCQLQRHLCTYKQNAREDGFGGNRQDCARKNLPHSSLILRSFLGATGDSDKMMGSGCVEAPAVFSAPAMLRSR